MSDAHTAESRQNVTSCDAILVLHSLDIQSCSSCLVLQVLGCYAQMASGQDESIEGALTQLLELAGQQRENVPVLLALASGFMLKKQTPKAR